MSLDIYDDQDSITFHFGDCDIKLTSNDSLIYEGFIAAKTIELSGITQFTGSIILKDVTTSFFLQLDQESVLPGIKAIIDLYICGPAQDKMLLEIHIQKMILYHQQYNLLYTAT